MTDVNVTKVGNPQVWPDFGRRNPQFLEKLPVLQKAFEMILNRKWSSAIPVDRYIFMAGHGVVDDFMVAMTLCGNAESHGAAQVIRPMFERVVTLAYLSTHPDEFEKYWHSYWIGQHKLVIAIQDSFGADSLDAEKVKEVEVNYQKCKKDYEVTACKKCGSTKPGVSWSPKDIVTMAKEVGMKAFIVPAYYLPLQHCHPTVQGTLASITEDTEGRMIPTERIRPAESDKRLCCAHALVLRALEVQVDHFKLDRKPLDEASGAFADIWKGHPGAAQV